MNYIAKCLLLLLTLSTNPLLAQLQGEARIDSMLQLLPGKADDTLKAGILGELSFEYASFKPDEGIKLGLQALDIAQKHAWKRGIARIKHALGANCKSIGDYTKALEYYQSAAKLYEESGNKHGFARSTGNMGSIYRSLGDTLHSLECFSKAVSLFKEIGDKAGIATFTGNIGNVYCDELRNYPKALEYMQEAVALFESIGDKRGVARNTYNIGIVYGHLKKYALAIAYFGSSLKMAGQTGDKSRVSDNLCNIAAVYLHIIETTPPGKQPDPGTISVNDNLPTGEYKSDLIIPVGKAALLHSSFDYLQKAIAIAEELEDLPGIMECYRHLATANTLSGNYKAALQASDKFHALQDSMFSQENREQIVKLSVKYDYDRQRYADSLKNAEKEKIGAIQLHKQKTFTLLGIAGIVLLAGFSFFIVKERGKSEKERKKSDALLLNILPGEIAEELKTNGSTTARHYDNVTVLFTDFVNFTTASQEMGAQGLIAELHTCFKAFDEITQKYNVEKIKTIGDAYLAVAGLPSPNPQHAEHIVRAAVEINNFMKDRLAKMGDRTFAIRIGIHSGGVVAGIVGVKKFAYDIWGDTVNTAARMEQTSEAGKINISQTTYELIKDKIPCEYRGEIDAKGKGAMNMYYVT